MAITLQTDAAGNLLVNPASSGNTQAVGGPQAVGGTLSTNPVIVAVVQDGANGAAGTIQALSSDSVGCQKVNIEGHQTTYSCAFSVTPAASATDIAQLIGSGSKIIKLRRVLISGIATSAATINVLGIHRSTANSGGTITGQTAVNHDANDAVATAICSAITANPTLGATGSKYGTTEYSSLVLGLAAGTTPPSQLVWEFGTRSEKPIILRGVADNYCVNLNGVQSTGQVMYIKFVWTEE